MITALIGAIGGLTTAVLPEALELLKESRRHKQEIELRMLESELAEKAAALKLREADAKVDAAHMEGVYRQFSAQNTSTWVDRLNALVRPVVTFAFLFMFVSTLGAMIAQSLVAGATVAASISVMLPLIEAYFSAILAFWFGNRTIQKNKGGR